MKKNSNKTRSTIFIGLAITCAAALLSPTFAGPKKEQTTTSTRDAQMDKEAKQLVDRLKKDDLVNEVKGFWVEKRHDSLLIDLKVQPEAVAHKYLQGLQQKHIWVMVSSLRDRQKQQPKATVNELMMPFIFSSPLYVSHPGKPGC